MKLRRELQERIEPNAPAPRDGEFVVYWLRIAARAFDNPALDVAIAAAKALGKPVFVYHAVSSRYRYASDRLHTFILESARDVQRALAERGVGAVFVPPTLPKSERVLLDVAKRAALVVTDFMPVEPLISWDASVAKVAPLWRVDASCLAPLWFFDKPITRAYEFTAQAKSSWDERLNVPWVDEPTDGAPFTPSLPFTSLDLSSVELSELVAACDIDHAIGPVHDTPGGATAATQRWTRFVEHKLGQYAKDRNDPLRDGASRMSAYLHFGNASVFRMARDCAAHRTDGSKKYLEELLTWRELAWHFCWHHPNHESVDALPPWARETLRAHERDRREVLPSYEQLARAQTGYPLWDAAQRSLLTHGELHNNVRMTWGKALLGWTRSTKEALAWLFDLNNRYALDGRDPASAGGILWCLGALDRPFSPEQAIVGTVRPRPLEEQARRFDVAEYQRRMHQPSRGKALVVGVVGAGVAGSAAARALVDAGHAVTLFDKGRGPGGRASTRKEGADSFDHGTQYFTIRDERFASFARAWWTEKVLTEWKPRLTTIGAHASDGPREDAARLVGAPSMSVFVERMQRDLDVHFGVEVNQLIREGKQWRLRDAKNESLGLFDALVVAVPAPQAATLIDPTHYEQAATLRTVKMAPCVAVMLAFDAPLDVDVDAAFVNVGPLRWISKDASKPARSSGERWVLHANEAFSEKFVDAPVDGAVPAMLDAFFAAMGVARVEPRLIKAHRWKYARTVKPLGAPCLWIPDSRLAVAGDWCLGARVEEAYLSGCAAAGRINALPREVEEEVVSTRKPTQMNLV